MGELEVSIPWIKLNLGSGLEEEGGLVPKGLWLGLGVDRVSGFSLGVLLFRVRVRTNTRIRSIVSVRPMNWTW